MAMALSRPVVASNVGGIPEMIEDGKTGLLVQPHEPSALSAAIIRLLTNHPLADTLGRAGHDMVHDRFCVELMVGAIQSIYDEGAGVVRPSEVPAVAIAGITEANVEEVLATGVKAIAVIAAVTGADDPSPAARRLKEKLVK